MATSKIEQELLAAIKLPEKKKEERQDYLVRVMRAAAKVKDDVWEGFSSEAQDWVNSGAEAYKAGDELVDFPDYEEEDDNPPVDEEEPVDEEVDEEEEAEETPAPVKAKAEKKPAKVKEEKPKAAPAQTGVRKVSACHMIKKMVVKDPKISVSDLSEQLKEQGLKVSDVTIATLRSDLRDTLRVMNELKLGEFVL